MSGHYLATTNPEAAEEARNEYDPHPFIRIHENGDAELLPVVGETVMYHCRPGEGRMGLQDFPALVMHRDADLLSVEVIVKFDTDDEIKRKGVRLGDPDSDRPCITRIQQAVMGSEPTRLNNLRADLDTARARLEETRARLDEMSANVYGEYLAPDQPLVELLANFEEILGKFEKRLSALEGTPKPKTAKAK